MEDKRNQRGADAPPQKAHPTGEFVVVTYINGGCAPFRLGSRLATVVRQ